MKVVANKESIKKADIHDLDELVKLFDEYRIFYRKESDAEGARIFLKDRIENDESVIFISRDKDDIAIGFTQLYPLFSSTRMARFWLLNDLFVAPEYRSKGYSKALIEKAKELCRSTNAVGMMLETASDNRIGNQLYPGVGFTLDEDHNFYVWSVDK